MSYVGKIKIGNTESPVASTLFGTCSTPGINIVKAVTCADFDQYITGLTIYVQFTEATVTGDIKLNINNTGEKNVVLPAGVSGEKAWAANDIKGFTYDGTNWIMHSIYDVDKPEYLICKSVTGTALSSPAPTVSSSAIDITTSAANDMTTATMFTIAAVNDTMQSSAGFGNQITFHSAADTPGVVNSGMWVSGRFYSESGYYAYILINGNVATLHIHRAAFHSGNDFLPEAGETAYIKYYKKVGSNYIS